MEKAGVRILRKIRALNPEPMPIQRYHITNTRKQVLPLPGGEGRGEGERKTYSYPMPPYLSVETEVHGGARASHNLISHFTVHGLNRS